MGKKGNVKVKVKSNKAKKAKLSSGNGGILTAKVAVIVKNEKNKTNGQ